MVCLNMKTEKGKIWMKENTDQNCLNQTAANNNQLSSSFGHFKNQKFGEVKMYNEFIHLLWAQTDTFTNNDPDNKL